MKKSHEIESAAETPQPFPTCAIALLLDEWRRRNFDGMAALRPAPRWMVDGPTRWSVAFSESLNEIVLTSEENLYRANAGEADYRRAEKEFARLAKQVRIAEIDLKLPDSGDCYVSRGQMVLARAEGLQHAAKDKRLEEAYASMAERFSEMIPKLEALRAGMDRAKADWDSYRKQEWRFPKGLEGFDIRVEG